jgi:tRNA(fMet)-specific endonuclease VapC
VFCLDTNVVIFAINGRRPQIVERLHRELAARTPMLVPAIVMFELEYGCAKSKRREHSRRTLEIFLSAGFDQLPFDVEDAREAGEIRGALEASGQPIGPYDTLIAAQARRRRATSHRARFS